MDDKLFKAYKLLKDLKWYAELHHNLTPIGETEREFFEDLNGFLKENYSEYMDQAFKNAIKDKK